MATTAAATTMSDDHSCTFVLARGNQVVSHYRHGETLGLTRPFRPRSRMDIIQTTKTWAPTCNGNQCGSRLARQSHLSEMVGGRVATQRPPATCRRRGGGIPRERRDSAAGCRRSHPETAPSACRSPRPTRPWRDDGSMRRLAALQADQCSELPRGVLHRGRCP